MQGLEAALSKVSKDEALLQENNDTVDRMSSLPKGAVSEQAFYQAKLGLNVKERNFLLQIQKLVNKGL